MISNVEKRKLIEKLLSTGYDLHIILNPSLDDVFVPKEFKNSKQLTLVIGYNTVIPINDLIIDDEEISCTLSFNRQLKKCIIPLNSILAVRDHNNNGHILTDKTIKTKTVTQDKKEKKKVKLPSYLKVVK